MWHHVPFAALAAEVATWQPQHWPRRTTSSVVSSLTATPRGHRREVLSKALGCKDKDSAQNPRQDALLPRNTLDSPKTLVTSNSGARFIKNIQHLRQWTCNYDTS
jgi:hypothetical protein